MVTTVPSALCFWICYKSWWILWLYLLLALIAIGIHTFLLVRQCCFNASGSDSLPDGLFSFFISVARSSRLLHYLPSCFPQGSNSHRPLPASHSSISVPVCPSLHIPPALLLLLDPKRCLWRKTLQMPWKMPMSLCLATEISYATASDFSQRQILGHLKPTFEQVRQLPWRTTHPGHTPGLWQSGEGTQSSPSSPAPAFKPWDHVWSVGWFLSLTAKRLNFRAAHTPPCWSHCRSALTSGWPIPDSLRFLATSDSGDEIQKKIPMAPGPVPGGTRD